MGSTYDRNFCLLTFYFCLALVWRRGWAFEVAFAETAHAPTEGASPLVVSPRGGHIPRDPPVRIPPSGLPCSPTLSPLTLHASRFTSSCGGEGGIRTHGPIAGTHAFQACRFDHSRTSPHRFSRGGILTRGLMTSKMTTRARSVYACHPLMN